MPNARAKRFADLAELRERARRACEQTEVLVHQVRDIRRRIQVKRKAGSKITEELRRLNQVLRSPYAD